jgi:hypothetical protein
MVGTDAKAGFIQESCLMGLMFQTLKERSDKYEQ